MCHDYSFLAYYSETGQGKNGKIFAFQNTNYRLLLSFITNFRTFKNGANGVDRSLWELNSHHGQENLKQHTINMIKSRFFSKNNRTYYSTKKGEILENIPSDFSEEEKWIIIYLLLIDAYFNNIPNYILKRTEEIYDDFIVYQNSEIEIDRIIKDFLEKSKVQSIEDLFKHDYIYYDTFYKPYKEYDFLSNYVNASLAEKEELYDYIIYNYDDLKQLNRKMSSVDKNVAVEAENLLFNFQEDVFSKKYKPSGVFNKNMLIDNAKILYLSNYINKNNFRDFVDFIYKIVNKYGEIENIDSGKIYQFIFNNYKDIFEICYINIFNPDYFDNIIISNNNISIEEEEKIIEQSQETSIIENIDEITKVSSILKRKALERANYKCELEDYNDCASYYFTNKKSGKNYVELHHLIPREFSNDFEKSIEQIENYVSLCPRCHRFIHFAVDRERKAALHNLYLKRIGGLKLKGINIEESQLKNYYRIED